jgi:hypothetical protein
LHDKNYLKRSVQLWRSEPTDHEGLIIIKSEKAEVVIENPRGGPSPQGNQLPLRAGEVNKQNIVASLSSSYILALNVATSPSLLNILKIG